MIAADCSCGGHLMMALDERGRDQLQILVTGARGFLGSYLCSHLVRRGVKIRAASLRLTPWTSAEWQPALAGCQVVIHLAARVHVQRDLAADPLSAFRETNTVGTLKLAAEAARGNVKRFVFVSSAKVHGESSAPDRPFRYCDALNPADPYAQSKSEAETGLHELASRSGMETVIIRPPLVYGPRAKANFAALLRAVNLGIPLPLASVVDNRRSFVALDNLVDLLTTCIEHPAAANQTFLVSDGEDLSTAELLRRLGHAAGKPARLFPLPPSVLNVAGRLLGKEDIVQRLLGSLQLDITHTREVLGWLPPVSLDEGLRRAVAGALTP